MPFVPDKPAKSRFVPDTPPVAEAAPVQPDSALKQTVMAPVGGAEMLGSGISGALARIPAGIAGLGTGAVNTVAGLVGAPQPLPDAADVVRKTQDALTYHPLSNSGQGGQEMLGKGVGYVADKADKGLGTVGQAVGGDTGENLARTVVPAVLDAATSVTPLAGGLGALGAAEKAAIVEGAAKPTGATPIEAGRSLGFKYRPSDVASRAPAEKVPGLNREGFTGSGDLQKNLNKSNTALATDHAGQEIGLPAGKTALRDADFATAQQPHLQVYKATGEAVGPSVAGSDQVKQELAAALRDQNPKTALSPKVASQVQRIYNALDTGNYSGPQMVKDMSWLRKQGKLVPGARDVASSIEGEVERILNGKGNPQQVQAFREARTGLAKVQNVQDATTGGQVDLQDLRRLNESKPGLLTGRLKIMADAAAAAPGSLRLPTGGVGSAVKATTIAGAGKEIAGKLAKKFIPGVDVGSESFQAKHFGRQATPTEQSYIPSVGKRPAPPSKAFALEAPGGSAGLPPRQGALELPPGREPAPKLDLVSPEGALGEAPSRQLGMQIAQGRPAAPRIDLAPPEGALGEAPSRQLGMEIAQGRPLDEQRLALRPTEGEIEPYQPSLLGHEGTPEGGSRKPKAKKRGKD